MKAEGALAPIVIKAGVFKNNDDLWVSPEHRVLISDWRAEMLFGENQVLVAAKFLVDGDRVFQRQGGRIEYFHIACDQHEIVYANGIPAESFLPTPYSLTRLSIEARKEFLSIFPEFEHDLNSNWQSQFPILGRDEARLLS